jgi:TonB family protein
LKNILITVFSIVLAVATLSASTGRKVVKTAQPSYPALAKQMHLSGTVKVEATVNSSGKIVEVKILGGHPVLAQSAADAARKFLYEPSSSETVETISFNFNGSE